MKYKKDLKLCERLIKLRQKKKLSQKELAKVINTTQPLISNYETGKYKPSDTTLIKYAEYFNVTTEYLKGIKLRDMHQENKMVFDRIKYLVERAINNVKNKNSTSELQNGNPELFNCYIDLFNHLTMIELKNEYIKLQEVYRLSSIYFECLSAMQKGYDVESFKGDVENE